MVVSNDVNEKKKKTNKTKQSLIKRKEAFYYMRSKVLKQQQQQKLAAIHYDARNRWFLVAPTTFVTNLSAILSLLAQAPLVKTDNTKERIALSITVLHLVISYFQSRSNQLDYGRKAVSHQSAASSMIKIYDQAGYYKKLDNYRGIYAALYDTSESRQPETDTDEGNSQPTSGSSDNEKDGDENYKKDGDEKENGKAKNILETLNEQLYQAVAQVDSTIPMNIAAAFNMLDSRITIMNKSLLRDNYYSSKIAWEKIYRAAYYQLSETIIHHTWWPYFIPSPKWAVEQTLKDLNLSLGENEDKHGALVLNLTNRSRAIIAAETDPLPNGGGSDSADAASTPTDQ